MTAASFEKCFQNLLTHEGGFVDNRKDPGGATKYGISQRAYPNLFIRELTIDQARAIYLQDYWLAAQCDLMPSGIDAMLFDSVVNHGIDAGSRLLQIAAGVKADGEIGPITVKAASGNQVLFEFAVQRSLRYATTKNFLTFGTGWIRRVLAVYDFAKSLQEKL